MVVFFNIVLFIISLIFGFEDSGTAPTLIPAIIFAIAMAFVSFAILKWVAKPADQKEAYQYSVAWALITFVIILIVTIGNGTTKIFLGPWYDWLSFIAMGLAPLILRVWPKNHKSLD